MDDAENDKQTYRIRLSPYTVLEYVFLMSSLSIDSK